MFRLRERGGPETNRMSRGVWTVTVRVTFIQDSAISGHQEYARIIIQFSYKDRCLKYVNDEKIDTTLISVWQVLR